MDHQPFLYSVRLKFDITGCRNNLYSGQTSGYAEQDITMTYQPEIRSHLLSPFPHPTLHFPQEKLLKANLINAIIVQYLNFAINEFLIIRNFWENSLPSNSHKNIVPADLPVKMAVSLAMKRINYDLHKNTQFLGKWSI